MEEEGEKTVPGRGSSKCAGLKAREPPTGQEDLAGGTAVWKGL